MLFVLFFFSSNFFLIIWGRPSKEVLLGCKDASVRILKLAPTGLRETSEFAGAHVGTVKCVRWRDHNVFASAGNDKIVSICAL